MTSGDIKRKKKRWKENLSQPPSPWFHKRKGILTHKKRRADNLRINLALQELPVVSRFFSFWHILAQTWGGGDQPRAGACKDQAIEGNTISQKNKDIGTPESPCFEREGRVGYLAVSRPSSGSQTDFPIESLLHVPFLSWPR